MPFYHTPEATQYLKAFIGEYYVSDDTPAFKALWRNYNFCQFVEDEGMLSSLFGGYTGDIDRIRILTGDVLFYRNRQGQAARRAVVRNSKIQ